MPVTATKLFIILALFCAVVPSVVLGADTAYRTHPELNVRMNHIKVVGILAPTVRVSEISSGGVLEMRDDWSAAAKDNVVNALIAALKQRGLEVKVLSPEKDMDEEVEDVRSMYRAVAASIWHHTYVVPFPEKAANFDYTLGSMAQLMEKLGVDAVLMVYGKDEISSGGRKALMATGIIVGALTGVAAVPRGGVTAADAALLDKAGDVLWFNAKGGSYDLRDPESTSQFISAVLTGFPAAVR